MNIALSLSRNVQVIRKGFPNNIQGSTVRILRSKVEQHESYPVKMIRANEFTLENGEKVLIPQRIHTGAYSNTAQDDTERIIYDCIYSRSTDGFVRETALHSLHHTASLPDWAMPYLYLSLSDYVMEVSSIIGQDEFLLTRLQQMSTLNPEQFRLTKERAISYWSIYYREMYSKNTYPALKIIGIIDPGKHSKVTA